MAGTASDFSTGAEWVLLRDVRDLVAHYCKSNAAAEELIIEFARNGHFRRYSGRGDSIDPRHWGAPDGFVDVVVDCDKSCVSYERKPQDIAGLMVLDRLREFLPGPNLCMRLVQLHRDDVLAMLRATRLLAPAAEAVPKSQVPSPQAAPAGTEPAAKLPTVRVIAKLASDLKKAGSIPADIGQSAFARLLKSELDKARASDASIPHVGKRYIENNLQLWELFPIDRIR